MQIAVKLHVAEPIVSLLKVAGIGEADEIRFPILNFLRRLSFVDLEIAEDSQESESLTFSYMPTRRFRALNKQVTTDEATDNDDDDNNNNNDNDNDNDNNDNDNTDNEREARKRRRSRRS